MDYYFINPDRSHYIYELAGILDLDPKNTYRKLEELEAGGLLKSEFKGKQRYFSIDKKSPLLKEYKKILFHLSGWEKRLTEDLKGLEGLKQVEAAKLMKISRSTFSRIITSAHRKIADGLVNIKAIRIEGGCCEVIKKRRWKGSHD